MIIVFAPPNQESAEDIERFLCGGRRNWRGKTEKRVFLDSPEWAEARAICLKTHGKVCDRCGSTDRICVDHVLPRSKFPELALEQSNLRPLCWGCNSKKAALLPGFEREQSF